MVTFKELISEYWAQTSFVLTLVFGLVGYIINRSFDLRKQKQITNHSLIQEHRIKAVNDFLNASTTVRTIFSSLPIYVILKNEIPATQMDVMITEPLNKLKSRSLEVTIFFPEESVFNDITQLYHDLNGSLLGLYNRRGTRAEDISHADSYASACNGTLRKVDDKMKLLTKVVRKTYSMYE